jgi:pilus assembly protein CpaB
VKARSLLLIVLSAVLGLFAVALSNARVNSSAPPPAKIVTAKVALTFGDRLTPENLQLADFPPGTVIDGAFTRIEDLAGGSQDRVALRQIVANEPILAAKVSGAGGKATLSTVVDRDMRAMTIRVNDVTGGGGFVLPQDRVDVLLTRTDAQAKETVLLLQNIKVLGVDQQADDGKDKPVVAKAVTLEVSPDDAQKLSLGASIGSLGLALRNAGDPEALPPRPALSADDIFAPGTPHKTQAKANPEPAPRRTIEILRGTESSLYEINRDHTVGNEKQQGPIIMK